MTVRKRNTIHKGYKLEVRILTLLARESIHTQSENFYFKTGCDYLNLCLYGSILDLVCINFEIY